MVSVDPFENTPPQRLPFCGTARWCRLTEQMLVSLYIFISIHVRISKGMEVNPPPQGKGMTQCFVFLFFSATVETLLTSQERLMGRYFDK